MFGSCFAERFDMATERRFLPAAEAQRPLFVGVDLGGTNVKCGVVDDLGRVLSFHTIPTLAPEGPEDGARRMGAAVLTVIELAGLVPADIARLGLGAPGTQDIHTGLLLDPPNLPGWIDFPLRDRVSQYSGIPAAFGNDASAATFGEFWIGSGRDVGSIVMFTLGTGIGSGIIVNGLSIDGQHSTGSECGHVIIDCSESARICQCGRRGHLEAYCGANAVMKRTREALDAGGASSLEARLAGGEKLTPLVVCEEAERGDALSERIILDTARYLSVGVTNMMHIIDPTWLSSEGP